MRIIVLRYFTRDAISHFFITASIHATLDWFSSRFRFTLYFLRLLKRFYHMAWLGFGRALTHLLEMASCAPAIVNIFVRRLAAVILPPHALTSAYRLSQFPFSCIHQYGFIRLDDRLQYSHRYFACYFSSAPNAPSPPSSSFGMTRIVSRDCTFTRDDAL